MAWKPVSLVLFLFAFLAVYARHEKYEGHQLFIISGPKQDIINLKSKLDFFKVTPVTKTSNIELEVLVRISPAETEAWLKYFADKNIKHKRIVQNLAEILRNEDAQYKQSKESFKQNEDDAISWDTYYSHEEINNYLDSLAEKYPALVAIYNAAMSYEGRQIKYVRISTTRFEDLRKPVIIINAGISGREWISTPVALYLINQLVIDVADKRLTEEIDWIIIPLANPDGYEYSIEEDRLWQKTRSQAHPASDKCPGVNIDSNFDISWGTLEDNADPCSDLYEGSSPFSEPETRLLRDIIRQQAQRALLFISLRSYGSLILYPWGNNGTLPINGLGHHLTGIDMAIAMNSMKLDDSTPYIVGNAAQVLSYSTGTSRDYALESGVLLSYELVLNSYDYGFIVPPNTIKQIVAETWPGIAVADKSIFVEQKIWANIKLNRIFDINYKGFKERVSRAEIIIVSNNTDFNAFSQTGIGHRDFTATMIIPTNSGLTIYRFELFTCTSVYNNIY